MKRPVLALLALVGLMVAPMLPLAAQRQDYAANIASLINPAKLATLKLRGANPRVQKCVYCGRKGLGGEAKTRKTLLTERS